MKVVDRLLALVAGLALAAVGGLVALEAGLLGAGRPALVVPRTRWDRGLNNLVWSSTTLRVAAIITIVAGAVLLITQLIPRRRQRLALVGTEGRTAWVTPAGVRRAVERAVLDSHDDVAAARARVRRRKVKVLATVVASADNETPGRVGTTVEAVLDRLEVERSLRVRVQIDRNQDRVR